MLCTTMIHEILLMMFKIYKLQQYYMSYCNGDTGSTYDVDQAYQMDFLDAQFNEGERKGEGVGEDEGEADQ